MPNRQLKPRYQYLIVLAAASLVFSLFFQDLMLGPYSTSPVISGDGLTIHYNLAYHAKYGEGAMLTSQYHPYAESIFMTDGHGLLATLLATLRPIFPSIGAHAIGISNFLVFWSNPLAALFLFMGLRQLKIRWPIAMIGSILIAMLSPQIHRQMAGQFTLGFTWLLPLVIWYLLAWNNGKHYWVKSLIVAITIYLLGLNNPYLYAIAATLLLAISCLAVLLKVVSPQGIEWKRIVHWVSVFAITTLLVYGTLAYFDTVADRVDVPFGFFHNTANWGGLLSSSGLFAYDFMHGVLPDLGKPRHENQIYLGLFGLPFSWFKYWSYDHLGAVLQFRAPARFGWPFYYLLAITTVYFMNALYEGAKKKTMVSVLLGLALLAWSFEAGQYLSQKLDGMQKACALSEVELDHYQGVAAKHAIDTSQYSSIFLLPTELGWTDKIHHNGTWRSNHDAYQLSLATGIPLLNGKLSRLSLSRSLQSLQITSDPLIQKTLLEEIDDGRDILVLAVKDESLDPEELRLKRLGTSVFKGEEVELLRLPIARLKADHKRALDKARQDTSLTEDYLRVNYEIDPHAAFTGEGSRRVGKGWNDLLSIELDSLPTADQWNDLKLLDGAGEKVTVQNQWINKVYETQNGWQRLDFVFAAEEKAVRMVLTANYDHPFYIDELLIRSADRSVRLRTETGFLYNGFQISD